MKRAYTNGILLDGTEQMQPEAHKILLTEDDKIIAIVDEGVDQNNRRRLLNCCGHIVAPCKEGVN